MGEVGGDTLLLGFFTAGESTISKALPATIKKMNFHKIRIKRRESYRRECPIIPWWLPQPQPSLRWPAQVKMKTAGHRSIFLVHTGDKGPKSSKKSYTLTWGKGSSGAG